MTLRYRTRDGATDIAKKMDIAVVVTAGELGKRDSLFFIDFSAHTRSCVDFIRFYDSKDIDGGLHSGGHSIALGYRFFSAGGSVTSVPRTSVHLP